VLTLKNNHAFRFFALMVEQSINRVSFNFIHYYYHQHQLQSVNNYNQAAP